MGKLLLIRRLATLIAVMVLLAGALARAAVPESKDSIKIVTMGYTGDEIIVYIYGQLIQKLGYQIEYTVADYIGQFEDLKSGKVHIGSPGWDTTAKKAMETAWASGQVLNMGSMNIFVNEDWWYPLYMKEYCPGLPDWHALLKADCVAALRTANTGDKARFLSGPTQWGGYDAERIEAMGLNFKVIHAESDQLLLTSIVKSIKRKRPIIAWMWQPFWLTASYPGEFVIWPSYDDACYEKPSWGMNPNKAYDCGRPSGQMWKAAWQGGQAKWPEAYEVYRKLKLDNETMGHLVYQADIEGMDRKKVAQQWIAENPDIWQAWIK